MACPFQNFSICYFLFHLFIFFDLIYFWKKSFRIKSIGLCSLISLFQWENTLFINSFSTKHSESFILQLNSKTEYGILENWHIIWKTKMQLIVRVGGFSMWSINEVLAFSYFSKNGKVETIKWFLWVSDWSYLSVFDDHDVPFRL